MPTLIGAKNQRSACGQSSGITSFRLEAELGGTTMPAFNERFGELMAEYPAWSHS
jgi:hypothetical protein